MGKDVVTQTLLQIATRLDEPGIPYAIAGRMALGAHGYVRATVDADMLLSEEGLERVHKKLEGPGYVPPFTCSKNLRDVSSSARVVELIKLLGHPAAAAARLNPYVREKFMELWNGLGQTGT